jgi:hypothetical protein
MKKIFLGFITPLALLLLFGLSSQAQRYKLTKPKGATPAPAKESVQMRAMPDLVISAERLYFLGLFSPAKWKVTVTNIGDADAFFQRPDSVIFGGGGARLTARARGGPMYIRPGESKTYEAHTRYSCPRDGAVPQVRFKVDPIDVVQEKKEDNNLWKHTESPIPSSTDKPDYIVTSVTFSPATPTKYDTAEILVNIKNRGSGRGFFCSEDTAWTATERPPGSFGWTRFVGEILPGQTSTFRGRLALPGELSPGTYPVTVMVDPENAEAESNESNNTKTATLVVK